MADDQLPLFESERPDAVRLSVSGSFTNESTRLSAFKLGQTVRFIGVGYITKVTHAHVGKGEIMERQHVLVMDGISFDEAPPDVADAVQEAALALRRSVGPDGSITLTSGDRTVEVPGL